MTCVCIKCVRVACECTRCVRVACVCTRCVRVTCVCTESGARTPMTGRGCCPMLYGEGGLVKGSGRGIGSRGLVGGSGQRT